MRYRDPIWPETLQGLAVLIALLNIIGWGIYGLVELVGKVVG